MKLTLRERAIQIIVLLGTMVFVGLLTQPAMTESAPDDEADRIAELQKKLDTQKRVLGLLHDAGYRKNIVGVWSSKTTNMLLTDLGEEPLLFVTMMTITKFLSDGTFEDIRTVVFSREPGDDLRFDYRGWGEWRIEGEILFAKRTAEKMKAKDNHTNAWLRSTDESETSYYRLQHEFEWGSVVAIEDRVMVLKGVVDVPSPVDAMGRSVADINSHGSKSLITYTRSSDEVMNFARSQ